MRSIYNNSLELEKIIVILCERLIEMQGYLPRRAESGLERALAAVILALVSGPRWPPSFLRTSNGAEIDLVLGGGDEGNEVEKPWGGSVHSCYSRFIC